MNYKNYDIIAIVGPTAVGKTAFSIELARQLNAEIINGDATQIYKHLNIGSAKITKDEMQGVVHHLIDVKEPDEQYTVADFQRDCRNLIADIQSRGKTPIIVGGSGLYIQAALFNYNFDTKFNKEKSKYINYTDEQIIDTYNSLYPQNEPNLDICNINRIRNFLIKQEFGVELESDGTKPYYDNALIIGLTVDRPILHERISTRVDQMMEMGLVEEVKQFASDAPSQTAIGYKEIHSYLKGEIDLDTAVELVKRNTRRFAKRQYTWFNNKMDVKWYDTKENKWL